MTRTARLFGMLTLAVGLLVAAACSEAPTAPRQEVPRPSLDECGPIPPPDSLCRGGYLGGSGRACC